MSIESLTLRPHGRLGSENHNGFAFQSITLTATNSQKGETLHVGVFHAESPYFALESLLVANVFAVSITITSVLFTIRFSISQSDFRLTQQHNHS